MRALAAALLLLALPAVVACGGESEGGGAPDGPLSVREAIERGTAEPQRVAGYVLERAGAPRLCEAILESYPPQCGEPSLRLEGEVAAAPEERVTLLGRIDGDVFRVVSER